MELGNLLYILICFFVPAIYLPTTDFIGIGDADLRIKFVSPGHVPSAGTKTNLSIDQFQNLEVTFLDVFGLGT